MNGRIFFGPKILANLLYFQTVASRVGSRGYTTISVAVNQIDAKHLYPSHPTIFGHIPYTKIAKWYIRKKKEGWIGFPCSKIFSCRRFSFLVLLFLFLMKRKGVHMNFIMSLLDSWKHQKDYMEEEGRRPYQPHSLTSGLTVEPFLPSRWWLRAREGGAGGV